MTSNKFIGYLVSVECKNTFYQGVVTNIDSKKGLIQLKNCFQNGLHCGNKIIDIKTTEIDNIEIVADPQNAINMLKPKLLNEQQQQPASVVTENSLAKKPNGDQPNKLAASDNNNNMSSKDNGKINQNGYSTNGNHHSPPLKPSNQNGHSYDHLNGTKRFNNNNNNNHYDSFSNNNNNNDNCFSSVSVDNLKDDFDFEKNLALFDKSAFYEQVEFGNNNNQSNTNRSMNDTQSSKSSNNNGQTRYHQITLANLFNKDNINNNNNNNNNTNNGKHNSNGHNYRYDQMVLDTGEPLDLEHQITTNESNQNMKDNHQTNTESTNIIKKYVTDDGFHVPCIDYETRERLFEQSYLNGFNKQRQIECMARCCTEMALQLVGGPIRFSPKNNHQKPSILVLANSQVIQGSYALCSARLLSTRGVRVYLYIHDNNNKKWSTKKTHTEPNNLDNNCAHFENELNLFLSCDQSTYKCLNEIEEIKSINGSIDLILNGGLDSNFAHQSENNQKWVRKLIKYVDACKASVLSIDPCKEGSELKAKWCLMPVLPMDMSPKCGRVYLCDLGFTKNIFLSLSIKYQSPFGAKFYIPLHND